MCFSDASGFLRVLIGTKSLFCFACIFEIYAAHRTPPLNAARNSSRRIRLARSNTRRAFYLVPGYHLPVLFQLLKKKEKGFQVHVQAGSTLPGTSYLISFKVQMSTPFSRDRPWNFAHMFNVLLPKVDPILKLSNYKATTQIVKCYSHKKTSNVHAVLRDPEIWHVFDEPLPSRWRMCCFFVGNPDLLRPKYPK